MGWSSCPLRSTEERGASLQQRWFIDDWEGEDGIVM